MTDNTTVLPSAGGSCGTPGFVHTGGNGHGGHHDSALTALVLSGHVNDGDRLNLKATFDATNNTKDSLERFAIAIRSDNKDMVSILSDIRKEIADELKEVKITVIEKNHSTEMLLKDQEIARLRDEMKVAA